MQEDLIIQEGTLISYKGDAHSVVIPDNVRVIGKEAFKGLAWLEDVTLPGGLKEIGDNAFKGCRQLKNISFPQGLERIGELAFHRCHSLEEVVIPDTVTALGKGTFLYCDGLRKIHAYGVKRLDTQAFANDTQLCEIGLNSEIDCSNFGNDVFTGCLKIKDITLSDGSAFHTDNLISALISKEDIHPVVRSIAESLFQSVEFENGVLGKLHVNLRTFELPEGIREIGSGCFLDKKGIVSIAFPESLERIESNAFCNCISLEQVSLKSADIEIDDGAFKGCSNLKRIVIDDSSYTLGGIASDNDIPYIIRRISDQISSDFYISGKVLMSYSGSEERVTIPEGVEIIGESAFEGNERLDRVILPSTLREIHENAFRNCICMQSVVMPEGLTAINAGAFENCKKLLRFNVPAALKSVGFAAFRGCVSLENEGFETGTPAAVRPSERTYSSEDHAPYSHCGDESVSELIIDKPCIIGKYAFSGCPKLTRIIINSPDCVIEKFAFEKCPSLKEISVNAGAIERGAFSFCRSLERAQISGVTLLDAELFAGCGKLREITLSDTITKIGKRCFDECLSLESIDLSHIRAIDGRAFERCEGLKEIRLRDCHVGYHAFADCCSLGRITADSKTNLQSGAFFGCTFVDTIVLDGEEYSFSRFSQSKNTADNKLPVRVQEMIGSVYSCFDVNKKYGIIKYKGDATAVRLPDDIVSAEDEAFRDHLRVSEIVFPAGFKNSGRLTFAGTGWLENGRRKDSFNIVNGMLIDAARCGESAVVDDSISRICSWAFAGNTQLKELTLASNRTAVDYFAFRNCLNLRTIHFYDSKTYTLESVGDLESKAYPELVGRIFSECINCFKLDKNGVLIESTGNIKDLVFPDGIREIADEVYMDCNLLEHISFSKDTEVIGKSAFKSSKWLTRADNAGGIKSIGAQAFSGCKSLESIDLSDSLVTLGKRAFEHCCALGEIHISNKLTAIPERAFFRCKSLKRIFIPASVKEIGSQAFAFCEELCEVVFENKEGVDVANDAFGWCDKL